MLDSAALFGSDKWSKICLFSDTVNAALALLRFHILHWIHTLLKSAATSYISNLTLHESILTEILMMFQQMASTHRNILYSSNFGKQHNSQKKDIQHNLWNGYQNKKISQIALISGSSLKKAQSHSICTSLVILLVSSLCLQTGKVLHPSGQTQLRIAYGTFTVSLTCFK